MKNYKNYTSLNESVYNLYTTIIGLEYETTKSFIDEILEDVNKVDEKGRTLLMTACIYNNYKIVEYLLTINNIDINIKMGEVSAIFISIHKDIILKLLIQRKDLDLNDKYNGNPILHEIALFNSKFVNLFLRTHPDYDWKQKDKDGHYFFEKMRLSKQKDLKEFPEIYKEVELFNNLDKFNI